MTRANRSLRPGGIALLALTISAPGVAHAASLQVARMEGAQACVALTFDDGPDPDVTPRLLSTLEEKGVNATFFVDLPDRAQKDAIWDIYVRKFEIEPAPRILITGSLYLAGAALALNGTLPD